MRPKGHWDADVKGQGTLWWCMIGVAFWMFVVGTGEIVDVSNYSQIDSQVW